jgi:hypothetical protein
MSKRTKRTTVRHAARRVSRSERESRIRDLLVQLTDQITTAENLSRVADPDGYTVGKVCSIMPLLETALRMHVHHLKQIKDLALIMQEAA